MPINQLYHTWICRLCEQRPDTRITRLRNFVWLMIGIYKSRCVHLSKVANEIPGSAKLLSITRRLSRFLDNPAILKLPRHLSVHPGGLVVAPGSVTDLVPVMRSGSKGVIITQLDLEAVEAFGLVKIDLLGIRGLTVL